MHAKRDILRFAGAFAALSLALSWLIWRWGGIGTASGMLAAPVLSAMIAAIGFSWRRKAAYAGATSALYLAGIYLAETTGLREAAALELARSTALPSVPTMLFLAWLTTFPLVMLLLFVGRTPSRLWGHS